jgi:hypothetical protein
MIHTAMENEFVPPCVICGKRWQRKDADKWVYHDSRGAVCLDHHGVKEWYDEMLAKADQEGPL